MGPSCFLHHTTLLKGVEGTIPTGKLHEQMTAAGTQARLICSVAGKTVLGKASPKPDSLKHALWLTSEALSRMCARQVLRVHGARRTPGGLGAAFCPPGWPSWVYCPRPHPKRLLWRLRSAALLPTPQGHPCRAHWAASPWQRWARSGGLSLNSRAFSAHHAPPCFAPHELQQVKVAMSSWLLVTDETEPQT